MQESSFQHGTTSSSPIYYVGVGASAGGLEALEAFFSHMAADSGMAFIVIQHLSPDYKSMMV
ncbi:MAG: chemotaxis protein CheB, partial [Candidatus Competibacter sp.]|nr:chemotaxis protein CheB [Candidatus Competibacter sp.]